MKKDDTPLVDKYLQSLEGMQEAKTDSFFYTRLKSRMNKERNTRSIFSPRSAYIICSLLLLLVINFWMINTQKEYKEKDTSVSSLYGFAETYNFTVSGY